MQTMKKTLTEAEFIPEATVLTGIVERLADGDTMTVRVGTRSIRVRLLGIDTPELHFNGQSQSPWAEAATRQLRLLAAPGAQVRLVTDRQPFDQYGRMLAYVIRGQRNVNLEMVRSGWAVAYQIYPNVTLLKQLAAACAEAQSHRFGIFDARHPLPLLPYEFRQRVDHRPPTKYCGNIATRRYVAPQEYQRVPVAQRVFFFTEADARAFGYAPAVAPLVPTDAAEVSALLDAAMHAGSA